MPLINYLVTLSLLASVSSCTRTVARNTEDPSKVQVSGAGPAVPAETRSLYARLGGKDAITAIVEEWVAVSASDKRLITYFKGLLSDRKKLVRFKDSLGDQICEITGGPCKYHGKDMKTAHKSLGIRDEHFDIFMGKIGSILQRRRVAPKDAEEFLSLLANLKKDIVSR